VVVAGGGVQRAAEPARVEAVAPRPAGSSPRGVGASVAGVVHVVESTANGDSNDRHDIGEGGASSVETVVRTTAAT
jgi:hypothetical protein